MPSGNLAQAIADAQAFCWDEGYGYRQPGMGHGYADGFDCSGLIGRVLSDNGFNYPTYHVGTADMVANSMTSTDAMGDAGFQEIIPTTNDGSELQPGDIVVMNHLDWSGGHTFIYMENILAYTDPGADVDTTGVCQHVKIEASSDRGHSGQGDSRKNGTGAYWEVWVHNFVYQYPWYGYDVNDPNDQIVICRWPGGLGDGFDDIMFMLFKGKRRFSLRRGGRR